MLGLQQESVQSATELAQQNRQTAQEETAATLENVLNAYQQSQQERTQLTQQGIEADSLTATEQQAQAAARQAAADELKAKTDYEQYMRDLKVSDPNLYYQKQAQDNIATDFASMTPEQYSTNLQNANLAITEIANKIGYNWSDFGVIDFGESGSTKAQKIKTDLTNLYTAYGLDTSGIDNMLKDITKTAEKIATTWDGINPGEDTGRMNQAAVEYIQANFNAAYKLKYNLSKQQ